MKKFFNNQYVAGLIVGLIYFIINKFNSQEDKISFWTWSESQTNTLLWTLIIIIIVVITISFLRNRYKGLTLEDQLVFAKAKQYSELSEEDKIAKIKVDEINKYKLDKRIAREFKKKNLDKEFIENIKKLKLIVNGISNEVIDLYLQKGLIEETTIGAKGVYTKTGYKLTNLGEMVRDKL